MKLLLLLLFNILLSHANGPELLQSELQKKHDLYSHCTEYMRTQPQAAYGICKEYLKRYPNDDERLVQYVNRWVTAYEKVLTYIESIKTLAPAGSTTSWFLYEPDLLLDRSQFTEKEGNYSIEIVRRFENALEEEILRKAEAVYPDPGKLIEMIAGDPVYWSKNLPARREPVWWRGGNDNVRLTNVVTASAVRYYYDLSQALRIDRNFVKGFPMMRTNLKYIANVKYCAQYSHAGEKFNDVYVADLNLEWSHICGGLCGMGFKRNKVVVLDISGNVLQMFLDAPENSSMWVS